MNMGNWRYKIDVAPEWRTLRDSVGDADAPLHGKHRALVQKLYAHADSMPPGYTSHVRAIESAATCDDFDGAWDELYDFADRKRIWINIF